MRLSGAAHGHRASAGAAALVLGIVALCGLTACTDASDLHGSASASASDAGWVPFGPFQKPAEFAQDPGITGAATIRVPGVGDVRLDAAGILPGADIESQRYTYAYDGDHPVIVAVLQAAEVLHYRRSTETLHVTYVLGLSAEREPRMLTKWTAYKGNPHRVSLTGQTDQGVVVIFLEGRLHDEGEDTRLDGIDVVRGTDVWWRQHGYTGAHDAQPTFYTATAQDACATQVEQYRIASGVTVGDARHPGAGDDCLRADGS
jgi:hypothetical protein